MGESSSKFGSVQELSLDFATGPGTLALRAGLHLIRFTISAKEA
jgi:hypothetical protein